MTPILSPSTTPELHIQASSTAISIGHPLGEIIRRLVTLWSAREASELVGQLVYL
jgi:hypothetical protein